MKKSILTTILTFALLAMSNLAFAQDNLDLSIESFDAATSVDGWTAAGDAASKPDEVTLEWAETAGIDGTGAMRFGGVNADGEGGRAYILEKVFTDIDFGGETAVTVSVSIKTEALVGTNVFVLTDIGGSIVQRNDGIIAELSDTEYTTFTFDHEAISASANSLKLQLNLAAGAAQDQGGTILVDSIKVTSSGSGGDGGVTPGDELLVNGDFEDGRAPWTETAGEIRTEGGNSYFFANVETATEPYNVNLSQVVEITQGERYILSFDASTGAGNTRTMIAGIGLNEAPYTSVTETINLTDQTQTFELPLTATGFGSANSRVLFDMGAETGVIVIDNVSLVVDTSEVVIPEPEVAAPAPPARNAGDVISLFSNSYDNITVDSWSAEWDQADIEDVVIDGNDTKKVSFVNFLGVDFASSPFDASAMTHFHIDFWVPDTDLTGKVFNSKWSNHEGGSGETNAYEINYAFTGDESGQWVSLDVPLSEANIINGDDRSAFAQFLITSNVDLAYVDNIYLYREGSAEPATIEAFSLLSPPDNTSLSLNGDQATEVAIEWSQAASNTDVTYTWHADTVGSSFANPLVSIPSDVEGQDTVLTLTYGALDATLADLGVEEGASITLDWTVTAMAGDSVRFADEVYTITLTRNMSTSIENNELPNSFSLDQNYPNPFNPTTNISYQIPNAANVTLAVFDITGREIARINEGRQAPGSYTITFDASNLSSGMYIYRIEAGTFSATRKMMLIK
ncbi:carbohydrate binding domain-containing protein [Gracilimonas tropica]|uniref:carbohydrate binding domain-containing protein n=1 Tax=Gracilimonas tropica TaxID=454600 RepID=UPI0003A33225|nr:carbohydrate binding domain-containing protein [Gracilimonas tropica]